MANEQNLKPFQKGKDERRNMEGRPRGKSITSTLRDFLDGKMDVVSEDGQSQEFTRSEVIAMNLIKKAIVDNDLRAIIEIIDRVDGKAMQPLDVKNISNEPRGHYDFSQLTTEELIVFRDLGKKVNFISDEDFKESVSQFSDEQLDKHIAEIESRINEEQPAQ